MTDIRRRFVARSFAVWSDVPAAVVLPLRCYRFDHLPHYHCQVQCICEDSTFRTNEHNGIDMLVSSKDHTRQLFCNLSIECFCTARICVVHYSPGFQVTNVVCHRFSAWSRSNSWPILPMIEHGLCTDFPNDFRPIPSPVLSKTFYVFPHVLLPMLDGTIHIFGKPQDQQHQACYRKQPSAIGGTFFCMCNIWSFCQTCRRRPCTHYNRGWSLACRFPNLALRSRELSTANKHFSWFLLCS